MRKKEGNRLQRFFKFVYLKLFRINDTPQKIALGFGLGVFLGILPGTGPIAALCCALLFRLNRIAALLGSLLTNTWISFVSFIPAVKIGSSVLSLDWQKVYQDWSAFLKDFRWANLFKLGALEIALPVLMGFLIISLILGLLAYVVAWVVALKIKKIKQGRQK
jgi:uncharacterized protein (DUF2062 family)